MFIRRFLQNLPRWPKSLRQSTENPLQVDRLPKNSSPSLEYPVRQHDAEQNRRHTKRILCVAALLVLLLYTLDQLVYSLRINVYFEATIATIATWSSVLIYFRCRKTSWSWLVYLFILPPLTVTLFVFHEPYILFALALGLAALTADLFATHFIYLKTAAPMSREQSNKIRQYWRSRFIPSLTTTVGLEFYWLTFLVFPAIWFIAYHFAPKPTIGENIFNLPALLTAIVSLLLLPILLELLMPTLCGRNPLSFRAMLRAFFLALTSWFTYNRNSAHAPGIYRSPAGTYRQRLYISLCVIALFATCFVQLFSYQNDLDTAIDEMRVCRSATQNPALDSASLSSTPEPTDSPALQRYEQAMLDRMSPGVRKEYLQVRSRSQADKRDDGTTDVSKPETTKEINEEIGRNVLSLCLMWLFMVLVFTFYPLVCIILASGYFLACCFVAAARVVASCPIHSQTDNLERLYDTRTWNDLVNQIQTSKDEREKTSLFIGVNASDDTPVLVPRDVFKEHAHILGDSGSGKTALGLAPLTSQLIRFGDCSVVVIDLKGDDLALFHNTRMEAEAVDAVLKKNAADRPSPDNPNPEYPFRWFTNELNRSTYLFNPLTQPHFSKLSLYQRTDVLTSAIGLRYGTDYGRGFFSDANAEMLYHAFVANPGMASFEELADILNEPSYFPKMTTELRRAASHLGAVISRLATCEPLGALDTEKYTKAQIDNAIDMADVFRRPQVLYFNLPSSIGSATSAEIARLVLYSLLSAAKFAGQKRKQVYLIIDEFQRIVAQNLDIILQTARSMNIGVILANQTIADLKKNDVDIISTVRANTRFKQVFAASDLVEMDEVVRSSGETIAYSHSIGEYLGMVTGLAGAYSQSLSETISPRLRPNDVLLASDHPRQSIVQIRRSAGYAQYGGMPFVMASDFHISSKEYDDRRKAPWPQATDETYVPTLRFPDPPSVPAYKPVPKGQQNVEEIMVQDRSEDAPTADLPADVITTDKAYSQSADVSSASASQDTVEQEHHGDTSSNTETSSSTNGKGPYDPLDKHWQEQRNEASDLQKRTKRRKARRRSRSKKTSSEEE